MKVLVLLSLLWAGALAAPTDVPSTDVSGADKGSSDAPAGAHADAPADITTTSAAHVLPGTSELLVAGTGCTCDGWPSTPGRKWVLRSQSQGHQNGWCWLSGDMIMRDRRLITTAVLRDANTRAVNGREANIWCRARGIRMATEGCATRLINEFTSSKSKADLTVCKYPSPGTFTPTDCNCGFRCNPGLVRCGRWCVPRGTQCNGGIPVERLCEPGFELCGTICVPVGTPCVDGHPGLPGEPRDAIPEPFAEPLGHTLAERDMHYLDEREMSYPDERDAHFFDERDILVLDERDSSDTVDGGGNEPDYDNGGDGGDGGDPGDESDDDRVGHGGSDTAGASGDPSDAVNLQVLPFPLPIPRPLPLPLPLPVPRPLPIPLPLPIPRPIPVPIPLPIPGPRPRPITCPFPRVWTGFFCLPPTCAPGSLWSPSLNRCISRCPPSEIWSNSLSRCISRCLPGWTWNAALNRCVVNCRPGWIWNPLLNRCLPRCQPGWVWNGIRCVPPACPPGWIWSASANRCVSRCPPGWIWIGTRCVPRIL